MSEATLVETLGYAAAGLVLATFSVRSIRTLRALAIASNLLFIGYALCAVLPPVLLLHALLLPLNVVRLREAMRAPLPPSRTRCAAACCACPCCAAPRSGSATGGPAVDARDTVEGRALSGLRSGPSTPRTPTANA